MIFSVAIISGALFPSTAFSLTTDEGLDVPFYKISHFYDSEENFHYAVRHSLDFKTVDFTIYTVVQGDNFWTIAKRHGVNIDTLIACNPHWKSLLARTNQKIVIPSRRGTLIFIEDTDRLDSLAEYFDVDKSEIEVQRIPQYYKYQKMTTLIPVPIAVFIPDRKPTTYTMTEELGHHYTLRGMFRSPLGGRFSSFFGSRLHPIFKRRKFHNGIDIAAPRGTYIGAACEGNVIYSGWKGGYGKTVVIKHREGYQTLYGHMSTIMVRSGQTVKKGQLIGRVGSTGYSTGPHLHFTIWHNGKLINPMKVLW